MWNLSYDSLKGLYSYVQLLIYFFLTCPHIFSSRTTAEYKTFTPCLLSFLFYCFKNIFQFYKVPKMKTVKNMKTF